MRRSPTLGRGAARSLSSSAAIRSPTDGAPARRSGRWKPAFPPRSRSQASPPGEPPGPFSGRLRGICGPGRRRPEAAAGPGPRARREGRRTAIPHSACRPGHGVTVKSRRARSSSIESPTRRCRVAVIRVRDVAAERGYLVLGVGMTHDHGPEPVLVQRAREQALDPFRRRVRRQVPIRGLAAEQRVAQAAAHDICGVPASRRVASNSPTGAGICGADAGPRPPPPRPEISGKEEVRAPAPVAVVAEVRREERVDVTAWLDRAAGQSKLGLVEQFAALAMVARLAAVTRLSHVWTRHDGAARRGPG